MTRFRFTACFPASLVALASAQTHAQVGSTPPVDTNETVVLEEDATDVVVTGTRFSGRTATDSPVPIDVIGGEELRRPGYTQINDLLRVEVPSLTTPRPSGTAALDFYAAPSLRGLSPGQLLLLVNGKRRHPTGDLSNGQQIGRGDVAYDLNAIPSAAIGRIEVLRDGAAAQYGSDAIARVINLVLDRSIGLDARHAGDHGGGRRQDGGSEPMSDWGRKRTQGDCPLRARTGHSRAPQRSVLASNRKSDPKKVPS